MNKKIFALTAFLLVFVSTFVTSTYAATGSGTASDVSIDTVSANGETIAESRTNLLKDTNNIDVVASLTATKNVDNIFVEAVLTDSSTGNTISDSTGTFSLKANQNTLVALRLQLIDKLKRQKNFNLEIRVVDIKDNREEKSYGIRFTGTTSGTRGTGNLDVSIDRVRVNSQVVAGSRTNFIDKSNNFDVLVEFTALEDLENAHVEAILKDLRSGDVVADSSPNFNLQDDSSSSILLSLELLDKLKQSNSFELTIRIIDAEGDSVQQVYGIGMRERNGATGATRLSGGRDLDISIDSVEVESNSIAENENNFIVLDKERKKLNLKVRMTSLENIEDAHVDAVLAFENGDVVSDATTTFSISDGVNVVKDLDLPLIAKFEQNSFKLKVRVTDADGDSEEKVYGLKISQNKFPFVISSIAVSPESNAEAGKNIVATLNFKNSGVVPLEGVTAKVSIPELDVSSTKFLDQVRNSKLSEVREDFILKLLDNVQTGTYTLRSEIASQFGGDSEVKEIPVFILGKNEQAKQNVNDRLVINVPILKQDIKNDGSKAIYPLTLTNEGPDSNTYTLLLDGANWADLSLSESNAFVIKPKESRAINIYASSKGNAIGEQVFVAIIKSNDKVLKQIVFKGNVILVKGLLSAKLKNVLEAILIGIVVLLGAMGIFFGVMRYMQGNSRDSSQETTDKEQESYY